MIRYEITAYDDDEPIGGFDISQNQMDMIALALCEDRKSTRLNSSHT